MSGVRAADEATTAAILDVEDRRQRALIAQDIDALAALLDDSLVHIHAPGVTHDKAQLLEHTATRAPYLEITRGELTIRVAGEVAIVTGTITNLLRTAEGGERTLSGVATQVLHREPSGDWLIASFQMTPYGEQAWPSLPSENQGARA